MAPSTSSTSFSTSSTSSISSTSPPYDEPEYFPHMPLLEKDSETVLACWKMMGGNKASLRKKQKDPIYLWKGVTVEEGRVVKLDWQRKQLRNSIPPLICDLDALKQLALSGNSLEGSIPSELGTLTNLVSLSLSKNELSGSVPSSLANMRKLKYLYLNDNRWDPNGNVSKQRFDKLAATQTFLGSLLKPSPPLRSPIPIVVTPNSTLDEDAATVLACWRAMGGYEPLLTNSEDDVRKWKGLTVEVRASEERSDTIFKIYVSQTKPCTHFLLSCVAGRYGGRQLQGGQGRLAPQEPVQRDPGRDHGSRFPHVPLAIVQQLDRDHS